MGDHSSSLPLKRLLGWMAVMLFLEKLSKEWMLLGLLRRLRLMVGTAQLLRWSLLIVVLLAKKHLNLLLFLRKMLRSNSWFFHGLPINLISYQKKKKKKKKKKMLRSNSWFFHGLPINL